MNYIRQRIGVGMMKWFKDKKNLIFTLSSVLAFGGMGIFSFKSHDTGILLTLVAIWVSVIQKD